MEFGLTDEEIMTLNFFVRYYGSYESLEAAIRFVGASALDHSDYVPVPVATDSGDDTSERSLDDQLVATEDLNVHDHSDYVPVPVATDTGDDTNEPSLDDQLVATEDLNFLEYTYDDLRSPDAELMLGYDQMRSLIVCYFPREANKDMIRRAFSPYGRIDSVYIVHKDCKPAC